MLILAFLGIFSTSCNSNSPDHPAYFNAISLFPGDQSDDISIYKSLRATFSNKLKIETLNNSVFRLYEATAGPGASLYGSFGFSPDGISLIFMPLLPLKPNTDYRVSLSGGELGIRGKNGEHLTEFSWSFKTASASAPIEDQDDDGLNDDDENVFSRTDVNSSDSDGDGLNDYAEVMAGLDPTNDSDVDFVGYTVNDPLYEHQWHHKNTGQEAGAYNGGTSEEDMNSEEAWASYAGSPEVKVAVVDTGIQAAHPDLRANLDLKLSHRYSDDSSNPSPDSEQLNDPGHEYNHGTACAGLIAARGWNGIGVRGVAPFARLAGLNVFSTQEDAAFQDALSRTNVDISSNSWGTDSWSLYNLPGELEAIEQGVTRGRQGKGVIYVFAAGNDNFNFNTSANFNNARFVINVGAVNAYGTKSSYSNYGANILVAAPGGEYGISYPAIVATDYSGPNYGYDNRNHFDVAGNENGDYTSTMNGTSAATPLVSGTVALLLQANPELTWRDVKYILAATARKNDPGDWDWTGVEHQFNHKYGFGVIDVQAAVAKAKDFAGLGEEIISAKYGDAVDISIPDDGSEVPSVINASESFKVEHVNIWVTIPHDNIWNLDIALESPSGTLSRLAYNTTNEKASHLSKYEGWKFASVRHLDEDASGDWTLKIKDSRSGSSGSLDSWSLQITGHE